MIMNKTKLQKDIEKVCKGHTTAEVIHAFEVLKLEMLKY